VKIKALLSKYGFRSKKQSAISKINLLTLLAFVIFCVSSFYINHQINKRLSIVENISVMLYQECQGLNWRLEILEARHEARRKSLLTFIYSKRPAIDSAYADLLANTVIKYSDKFQHLYPALLISLVWYESGFDTLAVSHKNAQGIMQVLPSTAQMVVAQYNLSTDYNLLTLEDNMLIGCLYLNNLIVRYGEFNALSRYNAGKVSNVGKWYASRITKFKIESLKLSYD